jgi:hypothetical protein
MVNQALQSPRNVVRRLSGSDRDARCLGCGERLRPGDEHVVRIHGTALHAGCALYRPKPRG